MPALGTPVVMPGFEPGGRGGRVSRWLRKEGDSVEAGEAIAELVSGKATFALNAPRSGVLIRIVAPASDADLPPDSVLALIHAG